MKSRLTMGLVFLTTLGLIASYPWLQRQFTPWWNGLNTAAAVTPASASLFSADQFKKQHAGAAAKIEAVFVLDTTSSMSGLIEAAKENIWSIASTLASGQPAPQLTMGLVAFRDRGDHYVTEVTDLSKDLDSMYGALMNFSAEGGGDGPESVNKALYDAVHRISWSQPGSQFPGHSEHSQDNVYRVIFLVGDAPPHMDYSDEMQYPEIVTIAATKGIRINTIQAGNSPETRRIWQHIARLNQGEFLQVANGGDAIAVKTPFDQRLATLTAEIDNTRLYFGTEEKQAEINSRIEANQQVQHAASSSSLAKRAHFRSFAAGETAWLGDNELVDALASGRVKLDQLEPSELPAELQALDDEQRVELIEQKSHERQRLHEEIKLLSERRQDYIEQQLRDFPHQQDSLNHQLHRTVKSQAAEKGIVYKATPVY